MQVIPSPCYQQLEGERADRRGRAMAKMRIADEVACAGLCMLLVTFTHGLFLQFTSIPLLTFNVSPDEEMFCRLRSDAFYCDCGVVLGAKCFRKGTTDVKVTVWSLHNKTSCFFWVTLHLYSSHSISLSVTEKEVQQW